MAERMTSIEVEWTTGVETSGRRKKGRIRGGGAYAVVAALLLALLIGGAVMHDRQETGSVVLATEHINKAERQYAVAPPGSVALVTEHINKAERLHGVVTQVRNDGTVETGFIGVRSPEAITQTQQRFMENNTTNLPNAATAETLPVDASAQQRFGPAEHDQIHSALEMANGATAGGAPSGLSSGQLRFLEVNTVMLPAVSSYPYAEDLTPPLGQRR